MTATAEIPEDVMQAAREAHADFARSSVSDNLTLIIAKAILAERQRMAAQISGYRRALTKLSQENPIGVKGNIQGQSERRREYARNVLRGGAA